MSDDNIFNTCIYEHCCRNLTCVSAALFKVHIFSTYFYICSLYSFYYRNNIDCRYTIYYINIIIFY